MGNPLIMVNRIEAGIQPSEYHFHITDHAGVRLYIFINLSRIHIQLENLCMGREAGRISYDAVTEPGSYNYQQIAFRHPEIRGLCTVHANHSGIQFVCPVKCSFSHQAVCDRSLDLVGKSVKFVGGLRRNGSSAYEDKRLFGGTDHAQGFFQVFLCNIGRLPLYLLRLFIFVFTLCGRYILRDIDKDRAGPAAFGDCERPSQNSGKLCHILDNKVVFCDRHRHAENIDFLKAVFSKQVNSHITGDGHHRDGIQVCRRNSRHKVGRAGS